MIKRLLPIMIVGSYLVCSLLNLAGTQKTRGNSDLQVDDQQCSWEVVTPLQNNARYLFDLTVINSSDIWAVGDGSSGPTALHWDGAVWRDVPTAPRGNFDYLGSIDAVNSRDIWAVGGTANPIRTLIEHWDGSTWQQVASPNPNGSPVLYKVTAVATNDVWAVGSSILASPNVKRTLVVHWDGVSWQVVPSPNVNSSSGEIADNWLRDIVAISPDDVWAVGSYVDNGQRTLILHWDGQSWQHVPSPNGGSPVFSVNSLTSVTALAANDIWAAGFYYDQATPSQPLLLHWDGVSWEIVVTESSLDYSHQLFGVYAQSTNDIWAVGTTTYLNNTLAMHWDGVSWQYVETPPVNPESSHLFAVEGVTTNDVWAVGDYNGVGGSRPLIEHYTCQDKPTPTPSSTVANTVTPELSSTPTSTNTPTRQPSATPTDTPVATATGNPTSEITATSPSSATPTSTPVASSTATVSPPPTNTFTALPTATSQPPSPTRSNTPAPTATTCTLIFSDVPSGHPFAADISYLACNGIVNGYPNGNGTYHFAPDQSTTRGELAKIIKRGFGLPSYTPTSSTFNDVPANHVFYPYIEAAVHAGVVSGYGDGTYRPSQFINRGEVAKITKQAAGFASYTPTSPTFSDVPANHFAYTAVETLYQHNIVSGGPCGTSRCYRPDAAISRGELSKVLHRAASQP